MISERFLKKSDCYNSGGRITPVGCQLHTIGTAQNTAESLAEYWNQVGISACVHYCVDAEISGKVLQFLPENFRSWADGGYGNGNLITVELMESDFIRYTGGASYTVLDHDKAVADIRRAYNTAVDLFADICIRHNWNPMDKLPNGLHRISSHEEGAKLGLSTAHVDPTHIWTLIGKTMHDFRMDVSFAMGKEKNSVDYVNNLATEAEKAEAILDIVKPIAESYNLLPSVATAQCILESGYFSTDLALLANNVCGMKSMLSGNTWEGSVWDGDIYTKTTEEQDASGNPYFIRADFRRYKNAQASIADRCAYLLNAMNGNRKRYNLQPTDTYREQAEKIKNGGYATDIHYVDKLCNIIERFDLARYEKTHLYRVRLKPYDGTTETQLGAFENLENAKKCVSSNLHGYNIYDENNGIVGSPVTISAPDRIAIACEWAIKTANDNSHGYDNRKEHRGGTPDYACSSYVNQAWREAGVEGLKPSSETYTADMKETYLNAGFTDVTKKCNLYTGEGILAGDVLLTNGHVEMCVDSLRNLAGARGNAGGAAENGASGDQTGGEIAVVGYWYDNWHTVLRLDTKKYTVQCGRFSNRKNAESLFRSIKATGIPAFIKESGGSWYVNSGTYKDETKAKKRVEKLKKEGFDAFYYEKNQ